MTSHWSKEYILMTVLVYSYTKMKTYFRLSNLLLFLCFIILLIFLLLEICHLNFNCCFHYCRYESTENMTITCSTKVCSFGKQVVEKVETEFSSYENGRYVYRIHRSPMCEYMINFIHKLKHLPEKFMMNSVLENFTILQVSNIKSGLLYISLFFNVCIQS